MTTYYISLVKKVYVPYHLARYDAFGDVPGKDILCDIQEHYNFIKDDKMVKGIFTDKNEALKCSKKHEIMENSKALNPALSSSKETIPEVKNIMELFVQDPDKVVELIKNLNPYKNPDNDDDDSDNDDEEFPDPNEYRIDPKAWYYYEGLIDILFAYEKKYPGDILYQYLTKDDKKNHKFFTVLYCNEFKNSTCYIGSVEEIKM